MRESFLYLGDARWDGKAFVSEVAYIGLVVVLGIAGDEVSPRREDPVLGMARTPVRRIY